MVAGGPQSFAPLSRSACLREYPELYQLSSLATAPTDEWGSPQSSLDTSLLHLPTASHPPKNHTALSLSPSPTTTLECALTPFIARPPTGALVQYSPVAGGCARLGGRNAPGSCASTRRELLAIDGCGVVGTAAEREALRTGVWDWRAVSGELGCEGDRPGEGTARARWACEGEA